MFEPASKVKLAKDRCFAVQFLAATQSHGNHACREWCFRRQLRDGRLPRADRHDPPDVKFGRCLRVRIALPPAQSRWKPLWRSAAPDAIAADCSFVRQAPTTQSVVTEKCARRPHVLGSGSEPCMILIERHGFDAACDADRPVQPIAEMPPLSEFEPATKIFRRQINHWELLSGF